jgi:Protein of unknown function (DUF3987)/VirE N-terminal domain
MTNISGIKNHWEVVQTTSLLKVYEILKNPQSRYRETIEEIRQLFKLGSAKEADKLKKTLPGFTCSGIFRKRRKTDNLESYSGMLILDLDDLNPPRLREVRAIIEAIPYTYMCFVSPSGFGLKAIVKVCTTAEYHKIAYEQVKKHYEGETGEKFDKTCDVARLTYISYDPEVFLNENGIVFPVELPKTNMGKVIPMEDQMKSGWTEEESASCFQKAVELTERSQQFEEGNRNNFLFSLACNCNRYGLPVEYLLDACMDKYSPGWDAQEIRAIISGVYNRHRDQAGSWKHYINKEYGLQGIGGESSRERNDTEERDTSAVESTPVFSQTIINGMPAIIRDIALKLSSDRERDTFITGALSVLSGCLYSVEGIYDGNIIYPNLYSFVIAPASSGKGVLKIARQLGDHLHKKHLKESEEAKVQYERDLQEYQEARREGDKAAEKPEKPPYIMLFVAGNSSSASLYEHLDECGGLGIICETEADTIATCFKNDWGNYSDILRRAFHHEAINYRRKTTDKKYIEVQEPKLSVALSGTASQVQGLIKSAEDGLFSRFIFYRFHAARKWRDVSPANGKAALPKLIKTKAEAFTEMVEYLIKYPSEFELTEQQWDQLNRRFDTSLKDVACFVTEEAGASVTRLGLIAFRIAMILSAVRKYEVASTDVKLICTDDHFNMAMEMVNVYMQHAMVMYKELPAAAKALDGKLKKFFGILLPEFTRDMAKKLATESGLNVSDSWVDKWLKRLVTYGYLVKPEYNIYRKTQGQMEVPGSREDNLPGEYVAPVLALPERGEEKVA